MATTGTNVFTVTRDDIIKASLRLLKVIGVGETPIAEDYTNCSQALNIMIKSWAQNGMPLWIIQDLTLPMVSGIGSYQIGPTASGPGALVMSRPLEVYDAFIRDSNNNDTTLMAISRQEYLQLSQKNSTSIPNQFYYDRQEPNGILNVYNVPSDSTHNIHLQIQRQFYDMTNGTDNFDFPEEFFLALKWGLAAEIYLEYDVPEQAIQVIEAKAMKYIDAAFNDSIEDTPVFFTLEPNRGN